MLDQVMNSVTDEEITQYLQSNGQDVNTALMASLSDETELPDADDTSMMTKPSTAWWKICIFHKRLRINS